jgi:hypothetical protein
MRLLVSYAAPSTFVGTTWEYLTSFSRLPGVQTSYVHVTHGAKPTIDWGAFDAVVNFYCARLCIKDYVSPEYVAQLGRFEGPKTLVVQDEYENTNLLLENCEKIGFDTIFTCVPRESRSRIYPDARFPSTEFHTTMTGFVPDDHAEIALRVGPRPVAERPIPLAYRGRRLGPAYGRLGRLKAEIGERMASEAAARGVPFDIGIEESDRIYGDDWFRFIADSRCMLGSQSGSNVFDWDGSLKRRCQEALGRHSLERLAAEIEGDESDLGMGQISPRVFECAILKTPMALIEGDYSGLLQPDIHFIPIAEDFSNLDAVFEKLGDLDRLQEMADRTYDDLVASGRHTTRNYAQRIVDATRAAKAIQRSTPSPVHDEPSRRSLLDTARTEEPTRFPQELHLWKRTQAHIRLAERAESGSPEFLAQGIRPAARQLSISSRNFVRNLLLAAARLVVPQRHRGSARALARRARRSILGR